LSCVLRDAEFSEGDFALARILRYVSACLLEGYLIPEWRFKVRFVSSDGEKKEGAE
jgi:hypothetical protein